METKTSGVAWFALILSIIALILSIAAFNRTGVNVDELVQQEVEEAAQEIEQEYQQAEVQIRSNTSDALRNAAQDVETDEEPNSARE